MATWSDAARLSLSLPEAAERSDREGLRIWAVRDLMFAWERPLRASDVAALGDDAPAGPVLALRVANLESKKTVLTTNPGACFTTPHLDGYSAVLVQLDAIDVDVLSDLIFDAWLARAPKWLVSACLASE